MILCYHLGYDCHFRETGSSGGLVLKSKKYGTHKFWHVCGILKFERFFGSRKILGLYEKTYSWISYIYKIRFLFQVFLAYVQILEASPAFPEVIFKCYLTVTQMCFV